MHERKSILRRLMTGLLLAAMPGLAAAQSDAFPTRPIRLVPCCAGIIDALSRTLGDDIGRALNQPLVIDTKPGASGMIAAEHVATQKPDGYSVLIGTNSTHAANQSLFAKVPYDFVKDFAPITGIAQGVLVLVANPQLPVKNVNDLTALVRSKPGQLKFGWGRSSTRAGGELYKQMTGTDILSIPYKTNPQATMDVVSGQIDVMWADLVSAIPIIKSGKLRALAVTGKKHVGALPGVPTMDEAGVPGYEMTWWVAAWAPANTPPAVVNRLHGLIAQSLKAPKVLEFFESAGLDPFLTSPDDLMKFQLAEYDKWRKIATAAGIKPQ
ncbi:MAG: tripartite tricarboxylate transporter substrate binding protein [Burkholderiales bacterium]|nr:tripartite tricarboxylate transporter substrate binding protein [Burkholderiales bacterium]